MATNERNPYEVLGVSPMADDATIKQAYRELAKKYHPDQYVNHPLQDMAAAKMAEINEAYELISTPEKRRAYDLRHRSPWQREWNTNGQTSGYNAGFNAAWGRGPYNNGYYYNNRDPYYRGNRSGGCCDGLCALCIADSCCECLGGDLISCC